MQGEYKQETSLEQKKLSIIRLLQILEYYSDCEHSLTQSEIKRLLEKDYGMIVERKAIGRNLQLLQDMFEKDSAAKSAIAISIETGRRKGNYLERRIFENAELRILIDGVLSSKFVPENYSRDLIEKLCMLSNKYFKSHVKHIYSVKDWGKINNKEFFYNIDLIDEAIEKGKRISFDYCKYGLDKKLHKTASHLVSPYQLVLHNQKYYLISKNEKCNSVTNYRVEKIVNIKILDESITPIREVKGLENGIDYKKIANSLPYMFSDEFQNVVFVAHNCIIDQIVDWFGENVRIKQLDSDKIEVNLYASPMAMECWAMQYLKFVEIKEPVSLREKIKENILYAKKTYDDNSK